MRVLVLRPQEEGDRAAEALAARGHEALAAPLLVVRAAPGPLPPGPFQAALATSARAVRHLPEAARETLRTLPLMTVGERAAAAARAAGFGDVRDPAADARDLAGRVLRAVPPPARLLYLAGRDRKSALEDRLAAAGYGLCVHVVYAADAVPALPAALADAIRTGRAQAAIHYSRRSAAVFCDLVARAGLEAAARRLRHAAISPDAARGLAALAPPDLRIAAAPNEAALLDALG